jgi:polar amino acid transport system substrate-binding protein
VPLEHDKVIQDLTTNGRLRASVNLGNPILVQIADNGDGVQGVTVDLARGLAAQLDVPLELVKFSSAGLVFDALKRDELDVVFLAIEPARAKEIDFTAPYVLIEGNYVVWEDRPIGSSAEIDAADNTIAVVEGAAYDLYLSRTIKHATLLRLASHEDALCAFIEQKLTAVAGIRQPMLDFANSGPGLRLIETPFMTIRQAMGIPKGRMAGFRYVSRFVGEARRSGFIAESLARSGQGGFRIAARSDS